MGDVDKLISKHGKDAFKFSKLVTKMVKKVPAVPAVLTQSPKDRFALLDRSELRRLVAAVLMFRESRHCYCLQRTH